MYDEGDVEIQLKERGNLTVEIKPTSTRISSNNKLHEKLTVNNKPNLINASVPLISSVYYYDKHSVDILRGVLEENEKFDNISSVLEKLIYSYIKEWDDQIYDPTTEDFYTFDDNPNPELESPFIKLPKELEHMFKLVRMNIRVQQELPTILKLLEECKKTDAVDEIIRAEIKSETYFNFEMMKMTCHEMMKLNEMYFSSPVGLLSEQILQSLSIKDLLAISTSYYEDHYLREPLKWLHLSRKLFTQKYSELKNSTNSNDSAINTDNFTDKFTDNRNFTSTYLDILENIFSYKHDYALSVGDYGTSFDNLFPKSILKEGIEKQSATQMSNSNRKVDEKIPLLSKEQKIPTYRELCNGFEFREPIVLSKLSCRLDHMGAPWYYLMPVKVEELHEEPQITFFHEVLSESKSNTLLQIAYPLQTASGVHDSSTKISGTNKIVRSSFATPLVDEIHPNLKEVTLISQYLSGLETLKKEDSEPLQVNTYKPGGHYIAHMDSFHLAKYPANATEEEKIRLFNEQFPAGDRMATILYYLNDVEEGGRTAFTNLGISVAPEKGGAVLWFSLFPSGIEDGRTEHAGCPVLKGVKSVANKWIRYNSQLFRKPCLLQKENALKYKK